MEHRIYVETHIDPSRLRYVVQFLENFLLKEAATISTPSMLVPVITPI